MTYLVIALICAGIGAAIMSSKNRSPWIGAALGGFLGIIGIVITVCLSKLSGTDESALLTTKAPPLPEE